MVPESIGKLSCLEKLDLSQNGLSGMIPESIGQLSSLEELHLYGNQLSGMIPESIGHLSSLEDLYLSENQLSGMIPESIGQLLSLRWLFLFGNRLTGTIPESIGQLSSLEVLDLFGNRLRRIPESIGQLSSLSLLVLSGNRLSGRIPESIGNLSSLWQFYLSENLLTGTIPQSIGQMSNLGIMNLSMNSLNGVILETHFSNLYSLEELDLSSNSLVFNVTSDWVPPFQLSSLNLRNCNVGPDFPQWLRTHKGISDLDISYARISDVLPSWFSIGHFGEIPTIDISHNQIRGTLEKLTLEAVEFSGLQAHFASNQFEGPIPSNLSEALYLDLSNNRFSEMTSFLCSPKVKSLKFLNLSSNHVSQELPDCWRSWVNLELLDLSNNAFSGKIPTTVGSLLGIETLKLRANRLVGELPSSLKNCTSLKVIDISYNKLSRSVPQWLGVSLPNLVILMLQSNQFSGSLPSQLCHLTHIQILDFSMNEFSGTIPKCLNNLTSLAQEGNSNLTIRHAFHQSFAQAPGNYTYVYYDDDATFMWKGIMSSYRSTLGLVKRIDLSSNSLTGEIPSEITLLAGLVSLNLSRNHLTGQIPPKIGNLKSLDSLDLSRNQIDGGIPASLARIDRLAYLDLSYNKLSGEIPTGTQLQSFDPSVYDGNPQLCGFPLEKICDPERTDVSSNQEDPDEFITQDFYISLGLGFAVGFWGVCGSLIFKRSWRYAYYKFLNASNDWLYVKVALIR
ncbi:hypothetical protein M0R45_034426 [Rubus argutus]|uniref:Disease resistance R13L4/SHOC-2-like LRR domain-containing protein n=1 Tax=Rubus argutus TaxID=59490 RepID=A0AAW1VTS0_RUBAR